MYPRLKHVSVINDKEVGLILLAAYIFTNPKIMCPVLILAASRKERVIGRTRILIDSIRTSAGASHLGAPDGSRFAANSFGEFEREDIIKPSQRGNPNDRVSIRWEVNLNI